MNSNEFELSHLAQAWLHSHEEDTTTSTVYRPAKFPFPPSRGRKGFHLRPDGTLTFRQPGVADQTETDVGTWKIEGENLELVTPSGPQTLFIESIEPNRLVVSKGTCANKKSRIG
jgi:hypothetical protein